MEMSGQLQLSDYISIAGAVVTVASMGYAMYQAHRSKAFSEDAKKAYEVVSMSAVAERLKNVLEHMRSIAPEKLQARGVNKTERLDKIRGEFDLALTTLPKAGAGQSIREKVGNAQRNLRLYEKSLSGTPDDELWHQIRELLQDAVSEIAEKALPSDEK